MNYLKSIFNPYNCKVNSMKTPTIQFVEMTVALLSKNNNYFIGRHQQIREKSSTSIPTKPTTVKSVGQKPVETTLFNQDIHRKFLDFFPEVVHQLLNDSRFNYFKEFVELYEQGLYYNVPGGKLTRGLTLCLTYQTLMPTESQYPKNIKMAYTLGWCLELAQAFLLVIDDAQDNSETRRGKTCWYKVPNVGLRSISDALLYEQGVFKLIKDCLGGTIYYEPILDLFHHAIYMTIVGQVIDDYSSSLILKKNYENIGMDRYNFMMHKTSHYSFHLPVAVGMYLGNILDEKLHLQAKNLLLDMGKFFQVQDDYLDVFGDEKVMGKKGTDIEDGKCSWLAVTALEKASPTQLAKFKECYGEADPEKIKSIKELYVDMGIPDAFHKYEEEAQERINLQIQKLDDKLPRDVFNALLSLVYKRNK